VPSGSSQGFEKDIRRTKQTIQYLEIKLRQRQVEANREYHESLKTGAPWPNEEAFINFQKQKKLKILMSKKSSKEAPEPPPPTEGGHH
jgi:hypothetical protein